MEQIIMSTYFVVSGFKGAMQHVAKDWQHANQLVTEKNNKWRNGNFQIVEHKEES